MTASTSLIDAEASTETARTCAALRPPALLGGGRMSGHLNELARDNLRLFQRCAALGGLVRFRVYWYCCHVLTDPELAGELLVTHAASWKKTRALQVARRTFGEGLVTSEGEQRKRQGKLLSSFFTPRAAQSYLPSIDRAIEDELQSWSPGASVDLHRAMIDVSLEIACATLFGKEAQRLKPYIREAAHAVQRWHGHCQALCLPYPHYYPSPANFAYRAKHRALDRAVYELIRQLRRGGAQGYGSLGALLQVRDQDGHGPSDREIRDHVVTLFLAGHDTTASSLAFTLYELTHRPELQERIAAGGAASEVCLEHVIKEALRMYPAVHLVARTALRDVQLGPYLIRRGEEVVLPLYVMQRSPRLFDRPDDFVPERWAEPNASATRYAYLPFSTGPRVCVGQALAQAELRAIIAATLRRFRLIPTGPRAPKLDNRLTLAPAPGSTFVRVSPR